MTTARKGKAVDSKRTASATMGPGLTTCRLVRMMPRSASTTKPVAWPLAATSVSKDFVPVICAREQGKGATVRAARPRVGRISAPIRAARARQARAVRVSATEVACAVARSAVRAFSTTTALETSASTVCHSVEPVDASAQLASAAAAAAAAACAFGESGPSAHAVAASPPGEPRDAILSYDTREPQLRRSPAAAQRWGGREKEGAQTERAPRFVRRTHARCFAAGCNLHIRASCASPRAARALRASCAAATLRSHPSGGTHPRQLALRLRAALPRHDGSSEQGAACVARRRAFWRRL